MKFVSLLKKYHSYEVQGMNRIPTAGKAMIVVSHSFATYENLLLGAEIYLKTGRYCAGLADRRVFQTPALSQFFKRIGAVNGSPQAGRKLLKKNNLLLLSPGGMRESLRPSHKKYQVDWRDRLGFVRLAIETQSPVILAACPAADDIFTLYENPVTKWIYKNLKLPFAVLRGIGPTVVPRPVKLVHHLSEPFYPPKLKKNEVDESDVREFHAKLVEEMNHLLKMS